VGRPVVEDLDRAGYSLAVQCGRPDIDLRSDSLILAADRASIGSPKIPRAIGKAMVGHVLKQEHGCDSYTIGQDSQVGLRS